MIEILKDKLYKLIKELKELREVVESDGKANLLKRFKIRIQVALLERILKDEGINKLLEETKSNKNSRLVVEAAIEEEENENK